MKNIINIVLNDFSHDSRVLKTSLSLNKQGNRVSVVALYGDELPEKETVNEVSVHRIKLKTRSWSKSKAVQVIKYLEFIYRVAKEYRKADVVHCNDLNALPIGILIKILSGNNAKVVYDAHEYETEIHGISRIEKVLRRILERLLITYSDANITVSDSIADEYVRLYPVEKPKLVLNCPPYQSPVNKDCFRKTLGIRRDQKIFLYQGGFSKGRGLEVILEAFETLNSDGSVLVCMGYGQLEDFVIEKASKSRNIFYHPAVSPDVLLEYTASTDVGISFIEDSCLSYRYCLPNKLFEYLMAGVPVLVSNVPEQKAIVEKHQVGIAASNNTVSSFYNAIDSLLNEDLEKLTRNVVSVRKQYCWEEQEKVLHSIYSTLNP